jgi:hypothetical protein
MTPVTSNSLHTAYNSPDINSQIIHHRKIKPTLQYTFMTSNINIFPDRASKQKNVHSNEQVIENIQ